MKINYRLYNFLYFCQNMTTQTDYTPLQDLVAIDSPSGFTQKAAQFIFDYLSKLGYAPEYTNKGAVRCALGKSPYLSIASHTDTLGAVVASVSKKGELRISKVGGPSLNSYEGGYCRIYTLDDRIYTGTLLLNNPSVHTNAQEKTTLRTTDNMHVRIDELVANRKDVRALGIQNGDFICFETYYQDLPSGFIKSRFMDNKAGCFVMLELARRLKAEGREAPVELHFTTYEEVGHGGSGGQSKTIKELLVIDMGVVGTDREGRETACSICAKDASGPYDYNFRKKLVQLAQQHKIPYVLDVYPFYRSDGSAALRAGHDFRVAVIGPGVSASHGMERTHKQGIEATIDLCMAYIESIG